MMFSLASCCRSYIVAALCLLTLAIPSFSQTFTENFLRGLEQKRQRELEEKKLETLRQLEQQKIDIERQRLQLERQQLLPESPPTTTPGGAVEGLFLTSVMTQEEIASTGFGGLSVAQQRALNSWVLDYSFRLGETITKKYGSPLALTYLATGQTHTLVDRTASGGVLILEDQTIWAVAEADRAVSQAWEPSARIMILDGSEKSSYSVVNLDDGKRVSANCVRRPSVR
ncbi:MAG: hypothetical protein WD733_21775 [Bryobacterales bacterium]